MPNIQANAHQRTNEVAEQQFKADNVVVLKARKIVDVELQSSALQVDSIVHRVTECFALLFPRLGGTDGVNQEETIADDPAHPLDPVDWEAEYGDVQWIEEDDDVRDEEEGEGKGKQSTHALSGDPLAGGVPYTLEISLSRAAQDVRTADNEVLIETVRELSTQLLRHVVPRLLQWRELLVRAIDVCTSREALLRRSTQVIGSGSSVCNANGGQSNSQTVLGKRLSRESESVQSAAGAADDDQQSECFGAARRLVDTLLGRIHTSVAKKCKELFQRTSD
eukprot:gene21800-27869_t